MTIEEGGGGVGRRKKTSPACIMLIFKLIIYRVLPKGDMKKDKYVYCISILYKKI